MTKAEGKIRDKDTLLYSNKVRAYIITDRGALLNKELGIVCYKPHKSMPHVVRFNILTNEGNGGDKWNFYKHFMTMKGFFKFIDSLILEDISKNKQQIKEEVALVALDKIQMIILQHVEE